MSAISYVSDSEVLVCDDDNGDIHDSEEEDSMDSSFDDSVLPQGERVAPGSDLSPAESSTLLYAFAMKNSLTKQGINELLNVVRLHVSQDAKVATTQYRLEKSINVDMSSVKKCFYCKNCQDPVVTEGDSCEKCNTKIEESELIKEGKYFLMFDIKRKLQSLLKLKEVSDELVEKLATRHKKRQLPGYASKAPRFYTDIMDGDCYRQLPLDINDFTCSINTDGVNVFKSSTFSIWPIFLSINELSYKTRRKHTLLVGLWFGKKKPSFRTFLTPFVEQCVDLSDNGFTWPLNGLEIKSRVLFVIISADSVARAPLQGLKQFNGKFGCPFCYNPGKDYKSSGKFRKWIYPPSKGKGQFKKRTHTSWLQDLKQLQAKLHVPGQKQKSCHGVLCSSPFILLPFFDIVDGCVVDYMHTALLGVLKTYTTMLIDSKNHKERYYLGPDAQRKINARLLQCKVPSEVNRTTRDLKDVAYWKANEWKTWLLICIPVLQGILPDPYLGHLSKLIVSVSLLISDKVSAEDIASADRLLSQFYNEAASHYSDAVLTYNMHLLTHAPDCVRRWGPLWGYSLFQFEHANGIIGGLFKGTRGVAMQIVKNLAIMDGIRSTGSSSVTTPQAELCLNSLVDHKTYYSKSFQCKKGVTFVGPRKTYTFNDHESRKIVKFLEISLDQISEVWSYKTMLLHGKRYAAQSTSKNLKISNCVISIHDSVCVIRKFFLLILNDSSSRAVCFVSNVVSGDPKFCKRDLIYKVANVSDAIQVSLCESIEKFKYITLFDASGQLTHACRLANTLELE
jgi:hypothetical protein